MKQGPRADGTEVWCRVEAVFIALPEDGFVGHLGDPFNSFFNPEVQTRAIHSKG